MANLPPPPLRHASMAPTEGIFVVSGFAGKYRHSVVRVQLPHGADKKAPHCGAFLNLAVGEGFEPSIRFRIHTFQACSFGHSDTPP